MQYHQLRVREFGGKSAGPHLLITGGVHGDEFEPIAAIRKLVECLSGEATSLKGRVTLVPCVNQDAFLRGTRCASDDLDLARVCPGRPDGTVTEQTAFQVSELIRSADFYIDLHTGGTEFSIHPLAGYVLHANAQVLDAQREMARAFGLPLIWGTAASLDGRTLSVARDADVPAIYCEYGGSAMCSQPGVSAYVEGCLNVMAELNMIPARPTSAPPQYTIEDPRENSGHLQVCNPSPVDGFFEPNVNTGQQVDEQTILGTVVSSDDESRHIMRAAHVGVVLMIRTFPRVRAGESIGVVVETQNQD